MKTFILLAIIGCASRSDVQIPASERTLKCKELRQCYEQAFAKCPQYEAEDIRTLPDGSTELEISCECEWYKNKCRN